MPITQQRQSLLLWSCLRYIVAALFPATWLSFAASTAARLDYLVAGAEDAACDDRLCYYVQSASPTRCITSVMIVFDIAASAGQG